MPMSIFTRSVLRIARRRVVFTMGQGRRGVVRAEWQERVARGRRAIDRVTADARVARVRTLLLRFGAPGMSLLVLAGALLALRTIDYRGVLALVPRTSAFWLVFALTYATPILVDAFIYRRLWRLPPGGLAPLARKLIGNELVVGYLGDVYLYAWARRTGLVEAGAVRQIKDVAILSAAASNATTVLIALLAAPFAGMAGLHIPLWAALGAGAIILVPAITAAALRKTIFSLPPRDLRAILAAHVVRAIVAALLLAVLWHLALPQVALAWWLLFAAIKLVLSRLPFMSNKDLVLAGVAVVLLGRHADVAALMTMIATLMTAAHIALGIALSARDAIDGAVARWPQPGTAAPLPAPLNT